MSNTGENLTEVIRQASELAEIEAEKTTEALRLQGVNQPYLTYLKYLKIIAEKECSAGATEPSVPPIAGDDSVWESETGEERCERLQIWLGALTWAVGSVREIELPDYLGGEVADTLVSMFLRNGVSQVLARMGVISVEATNPVSLGALLVQLWLQDELSTFYDTWLSIRGDILDVIYNFPYGESGWGNALRDVYVPVMNASEQTLCDSMLDTYFLIGGAMRSEAGALLVATFLDRFKGHGGWGVCHPDNLGGEPSSECTNGVMYYYGFYDTQTTLPLFNLGEPRFGVTLDISYVTGSAPSAARFDCNDRYTIEVTPLLFDASDTRELRYIFGDTGCEETVISGLEVNTTYTIEAVSFEVGSRLYSKRFTVRFVS